MALTLCRDGPHTSYMAKDFLAEIAAERTAKNGGFPKLVAEAEVRRKLARRLAALREKSLFRKPSWPHAWAHRHRS